MKRFRKPERIDVIKALDKWFKQASGNVPVCGLLIVTLFLPKL